MDVSLPARVLGHLTRTRLNTLQRFPSRAWKQTIDTPTTAATRAKGLYHEHINTLHLRQHNQQSTANIDNAYVQIHQRQHDATTQPTYRPYASINSVNRKRQLPRTSEQRNFLYQNQYRHHYHRQEHTSTWTTDKRGQE